MGFFDFLKPTPTPAPTYSSVMKGSKLYDIAKLSVKVLENSYRSLTEKGKLEATLFNATYLLSILKLKNISAYESAKFDLIIFLSTDLRKIGIEWNHSQLKHFITSREATFLHSQKQIFTMKSSGYMPFEIYAAFYETPLQETAIPSSDFPSVLQFMPAFIEMINFNTRASNNL